MKEQINVTIEMDADLYRQANEVSHEFGMTLEEACTLFAEETARLGRLPFELTAEDWAFVRNIEAEKVKRDHIEKINRGIEQVRSGLGIVKTMEELEAMAEDES